jgi:hypothetical protein
VTYFVGFYEQGMPSFKRVVRTEDQVDEDLAACQSLDPLCFHVAGEQGDAYCDTSQAMSDNVDLCLLSSLSWT